MMAPTPIRGRCQLAVGRGNREVERCIMCAWFSGPVCIGEGRLPGVVSGALDHKSLPPEFESRCEHI